MNQSRLLTIIAIILLLSLLPLAVSNAKSQPKVNVSVKLSSQQVWQREQVLLSLELITDDPFSRLEIEPFQQQGFSIVSFDQTRVENTNHTILSKTWALYPFVAGDYKLELPRIRYRPNRGRIITLDLDEPSLKVRRLPVYVPPTMPVGKININSAWNNGWLVPNNSLLEWELTVIGESVAKQTLPPITRQLISTDAVQFFPTQKTEKSIKTGGGVKQIQHYKIPVKALNYGLLALPEIKIQYFEPKKGELQSSHLKTPFIIVLGQWLIWLLGFLLVIALLVLIIYVIKKVKPVIKRSQQKKQALRSLAIATNYTQIKEALAQLSHAHGWVDNHSLSDFLALWESKFGASQDLSSAIFLLQDVEFSNNKKTDVEAIRHRLLKALREA